MVRSLRQPETRSRRLALAAAAGAGGLVCALGAGVAFVDAFHLAYGGELTASGVAGFFLFLAVAFALAPWHPAARVGAAAGAGALGLVLVVLMALAMVVFTDRTSVVRSTRAGDGPELVVLWRHYSVDLVPEVRLRKGSGPFRQESLVYSGPLSGGGELPADVRFSGDRRVTFTVGDCRFVSGYDPLTLEVDPVHGHRPGC